MGAYLTGDNEALHFAATVWGTELAMETMVFTPDLVMKSRSVHIPSKAIYREIYEGGKLLRRAHYEQRQVPAGIETFIAREEVFARK